MSMGMSRICQAITGRYVYVTVQGVEYRVYFEEAGEGMPVLCQHTAGSDGRQWRHLLEDPELTKEFRIVATDLPYHGKSLPPTEKEWWSERYSLNQAFLLDFVSQIAAALDLEGGVYIGCSMGGHLAPDLALMRPGLFRAVLAVQGGLATHDPEPFNYSLSHPRVSNESKAALMIFQGDLDYYLGEHDLTDAAPDIDTSKTEVHVLAGEYDWSATPERAKALADAIPGGTFTALEGMGHFPMSESPEEFKTYVMPLLRGIAERAGSHAR